MKDYLEAFLENSSHLDIANLMPEGICPFLFYSLTPYIFTLANEGWFIWVKRTKDISYRKAIEEVDFKKRDINQLYPNEVLVRCPNPGVNVVAGIGPWLGKAIKIRILHSADTCPYHHLPEDNLVMDKSETKVKTLDFNRRFPQALSLSLSGRLSDRRLDLCKTEMTPRVRISKIIYPCRYHKKEREFKTYLMPEGFCAHIFHLIYPYILALMYNARVEKKLMVRCSLKGCDIALNLERADLIKNTALRALFNLLKKIYGAFLHPIDIIDYSLKINITSIRNKPTECVLKEPKDYPVNLRNEDFLCPASLHTLYPYLLLYATGFGMDWNCPGTENQMPCPDIVGVKYKIG